MTYKTFIKQTALIACFLADSLTELELLISLTRSWLFIVANLAFACDFTPEKFPMQINLFTIYQVHCYRVVYMSPKTF